MQVFSLNKENSTSTISLILVIVSIVILGSIIYLKRKSILSLIKLRNKTFS